MSIETALRSAGRLLVGRPSDVLPYYGVVAGTADAARVPLLLAAAIAYASLSTSGRLAPFIEELAALNPERLDPATPGDLPPAFAAATADLLTPTVVVTLVAGVAVAFLVFLVVGGIVRAGALSAVEGGLVAGRDADPLRIGVRGLAAHWRTFVGLAAVRWLLLAAAAVPLLAALVGVAGTLSTASGAPSLDRMVAGSLLAALVAGLLTVGAVIVVLALLAFAGPAVVVDGVDLRGALRRSVAFPVRHPGSFLLYVVVVISVYVVVGVLAGLFSIAGVSRVNTLLSALAVSPFLDAVAVALYADVTADEGATAPEPSNDEVERDPAGVEPAGFERSDAHAGDDSTAEPDADHAGDDSTAEPDADHAGDGPAVEPDADHPDDGFVWGQVVEEDVDGPDGPDGSLAVDSPDVAEAEAAVSAATQPTTADSSDAAATEPPPTPDAGVLARLRAAFADGLGALGGFLRRDLRYVVVAAAVLLVGVAGGWTATADSGVRLPTPAEPGLVFGAVPVGPFVEIAANNWFVALTTGFSGLFAGLPTVGTLLFNGLLVGAVAGVVDPLAFAALVGPHGVVELPAIAVAGGVGLRLGHVSWRAWRGTDGAGDVAAELRRSWRVLLGLAVVFVLAAFVEAFLTPRVAAVVLGG